ncbi:uncharacterized protein LOC142350827 [Convolutriloba macropyga]|uniref:uncharacterized protein LOC142350827 n=1 Tax=Convolutriloba macropyga TaxID=536237 RepID=UPI003F51E032
MQHYRSLNWFNLNPRRYQNNQICCAYQAAQYFMTGRPAGYSPEEYVSKLADFSDDNKFLNSITVRYNQSQCVNIIERLTFGTPVEQLVVLGFGNHPINFQRPFLMVPQDRSDIHVFDISQSTHEIHQRLTFAWFKDNYICKDHPDVCHTNLAFEMGRMNLGGK